MIDAETFLEKALERAARLRLAHSTIHKNISAEHKKIAKALGALGDSTSDKNLSTWAQRGQI